ncbi:MAG: glycoside hydrolase family 3 C-terminal domain-containing protein [Bacteroidaceae bacterium]|nr:glycoside hydrolase family 3 C-terminal domain-containing protein [Bacteroidaceae bacterium]
MFDYTKPNSEHSHIKWILMLCLQSAYSILLSAQTLQLPKSASEQQREEYISSVVAKMTLEEKVGQMCELAIDKVAQRSSDSNVPSNQSVASLAGGKLSATAVNDVFSTWKVGSILNVPEGLAPNPKVWSDIIRNLNKASYEQCNGITEIYGVDQIHGASYSWGATLFPQEIGQAASFNINIPYRIGQITAYESRACLIPWVYAPVMDLARSPLWPRMWESYGEDVLVNAKMASAVTRGLQGDDREHIGMNNVAVCIKHYMAYGAAVSGKDRTPSSVTDRELMEKYFQPFKACIEAGALSLMVNSGNNNGVPFHANHKLLTEWVKEGLHWDGMIVTDWADIDNLWKRDHIAANKKDAIGLAINAGIDMTMDPYSTDFCPLLIELVNEGRVSMKRIDDAVARILRLKLRLGLLDRSTWDIPYDKPAKGNKSPTLVSLYPDYGSEKFAQEALKMTEECIVLLKNKSSILPLAKEKKILVCGPNANNFRPMNGGWSYTWQGDRTDEVCRQIGKYHTFYEGLVAKYGKNNVILKDFVKYSPRNFNMDIASEPVEVPADIDVIVACIGENSYCETVGNIDDLNLSHNQIEMVKSLAKFGKPIILILNEGRPRLIKEIEPLVTAIIHTFLPSNYGGDALANLIAGDANFSGRMPYTYPKNHGSFITYDCKPCEYVETMPGAYNYEANTTVQWAFGYGLSYSDVKYSNLKADVKADKITFTVDVVNNSEREVKEPILLFVSDLVASLTPDIKRLRAFDKVNLLPHESKTVTLSIKPSDLAFVDNNLNWVLEPGQFRATIANQRVTFDIVDIK